MQIKRSRAGRDKRSPPWLSPSRTRNPPRTSRFQGRCLLKSTARPFSRGGVSSASAPHVYSYNHSRKSNLANTRGYRGRLPEASASHARGERCRALARWALRGCVGLRRFRPKRKDRRESSGQIPGRAQVERCSFVLGYNYTNPMAHTPLAAKLGGAGPTTLGEAPRGSRPQSPGGLPEYGSQQVGACRNPKLREWRLVENRNTGSGAPL
jgi:hypothetical protein